MEKQTEEMARSCIDCIHYEICSLWTTTDLDADEAYKYCFGRYRPRIPENAVVLNVSEYVRLKSIEENINRVIKQKCKDTAKEIYEEIYRISSYMQYHGKEYRVIDLKRLQELAKEKGVEVE